MAELTFPFTYVPDFTKGKPVALGDIYVGVQDLDPKTPANQITIQAKQENGSLVALTQPVKTSAGGVPTLNGSPISIITTDAVFSVRVDNAQGSQVYYQAQVNGLTGAINSYDNLADALVGSDGIGSFVEWVEYTTGTGIGGNIAKVVTGGTGTPDGGSYFNKTDGSGLQLQALFKNGEVDLAQFGFTMGSVTDTVALANTIVLQAAMVFAEYLRLPPSLMKCKLLSGDTFAASNMKVSGAGFRAGSQIEFFTDSTSFFTLFDMVGGNATVSDFDWSWTTPTGSAGMVGYNIGNGDNILMDGIYADLDVQEVAGAQNASNHIWNVTGSANNVTIKNSYFTHFKFGVLKTNVATASNDNWLFDGVGFKDFFSPALTFNTPSGDWDNVRVVNCYLADNLAESIGGAPVAFPHFGGLAGGAGSGRFVFSNNTLSGVGQGWHFEEGAEEVIISDSNFSLTDTVIKVLDNNVGGTPLTPSKFIVEGNTIIQTGTPLTDTGSVTAIDMAFDASGVIPIEDYRVSGNIIEGFDRGMSTERGAFTGQITNNNFKDCVLGARMVSGNSDFHSNKFKDCTVGIENISEGGMIGKNTFINTPTPLSTNTQIMACAGLGHVINALSLPAGNNQELILFPIGRALALRAVVHLSSDDISMRFEIFDLVWDGTTLTGNTTPTVKTGSGNVGQLTFEHTAGNLVLELDNSTGGTRIVDINISFEGGYSV